MRPANPPATLAPEPSPMIAHVRPRPAAVGLLACFLVVGLGLAAPKEAEVKLTTAKYDAMIQQIAAKKAKLTVADAWATWCGPCKENFPHLVAMHKKYADRGIAFASISLDNVGKPKDLAAATEFLTQKQANFTNFVLDESMDDAFEKLDITSIPAVFLFGPDGKVVRRFTLDDPNNQFTYEQVEAAVQEFLAGKPMTTGEAPKAL